MIISIPVETSVVNTNVTDDREIYDPTKTYADKTLLQYDPDGGLNYAIYS